MTRTEAALLVLAVAMSLATGFFRIDEESIWGDEAVSIREVGLPWPDFLAAIFGDKAYSGLYYVLLRLATAVAGMSEIAVRLPSALFVAAAIPMLYLIGRSVGGKLGGTFAIGLALSSAFLIHYSQEARAYALAYLLVAVATVLFIRVVRQPGTGRWILYAVAAVLAAHAHFFAGFVIAAQMLWALAALPRDRPRLLLVAGAGALSLLPLGLNILNGMPRAWIPGVGTGRLTKVISSLVGADLEVQDGRLLTLMFIFGILLAIAAILLGAGLLGCRVVSRQRNAPSGRSGPPSTGALRLLLLACVVVPIAGSAILSIWKPIVVPRYLIVVEPALLPLVAAGFASLRPRWIGVAAIAVTMVVGAAQTMAWYREPTKLDYRGAARQVLAAGEPGDIALVFPPGLGYVALDYYLDHLPEAVAAPTIDAASTIRARLAWSMVDGLSGARPRIWLVVMRIERVQQHAVNLWLDALNSRYTEEGRFQQPDFTIYLFESRPTVVSP